MGCGCGKRASAIKNKSAKPILKDKRIKLLDIRPKICKSCPHVDKIYFMTKTTRPPQKTVKKRCKKSGKVLEIIFQDPHFRCPIRKF